MADASFDALLALQCDSGAFPSVVDGPEGPLTDETCFVTAQVCLILSGQTTAGADPRRARALSRGLDFVARCASETRPGAFHFYPPRAATPRLVQALPADLDDTALAWLALMAGGRRSAAEARHLLPPLLEPARVRVRGRGDAPWVRRDLFRTWMDGPAKNNPVDLIVSINLAACLAAADLPVPPAIVSAVEVALGTHAPSRGAMRVLAPYYVDPAEILHALDRAVAAGAAALALAREEVCRVLGDGAEERTPDAPLYCNAHGRPIWRSPALRLARGLPARSDVPPCPFSSPLYPETVS